MAKRIIYFSAMLLSLSACIPSNNGFYSQQQGYYGNSPMQPQAYGSAYQSQSELPTNFGNVEYSEFSNSEYSMGQTPAPKNPWEMNQQAHPQNFNENLNAFSNAAPISPSMTMRPVPRQQYKPKGVVGIGQALQDQNQSSAVVPQQVVSSSAKYAIPASSADNKLISPSAWRMAHPSIGNGLELINKSERFDLNNKLNDVKVKQPATVTIGGQKVTVLGLNATGVTNLKGFLCKEAYLVQPQRGGQVATTWGKFCRHPNWNEWILTKW